MDVFDYTFNCIDYFQIVQYSANYSSNLLKASGYHYSSF